MSKRANDPDWKCSSDECEDCHPQQVQAVKAVGHYSSPPNHDRLDMMFANQHELMQRFPKFSVLVDFNRLVLPEHDHQLLTAQIDDIATCIMQEAAELRDWVPWKHWSQRLGNKREDIELWTPEHIAELRMEVIDLLHFVLEAAICLGMGTNELFALWRHKAGVNVDRQKQGDY